MLLRTLAVLALLLSVPAVGAQTTLGLDDFEEPQKGPADTLWKIVVIEEQSHDPRAVVFRNAVNRPFNLTIVAENGTTVYSEQGSRGVRTLPPLSAGTYSAYTRFREGEFQIIRPAFGVNLNESTNGTLRGKADAYIIAIRSNVNYTVAGDVQAEWFDIRQNDPEHPSVPFTRTAVPGAAYILTLTGDEGAAYSIGVEPTTYVPPVTTPDHSGHEETPGPAPLLVLAGLAAVALVLRRRGVR